ncbi:MAG: DUF3618 domain-containing protein, partial [Acidobacteria bacterium]|nr:DUF3618 domain-containing protein [Acidobacteriota bacterium]
TRTRLGITATREASEDGADEPAQRRAEIEQTRAEMSETIDAIQEKFSPENIKEQVKEQVSEAVQSAKDSVREATIGRAEKIMENVNETVGRAGTAVRETGSSIIDTIRQNPLPAALIGLGIGMLMMNRNQRRSGYYRADRRMRQTQGPSVVEQAQDTESNVASQTREQIGNLGSRVQQDARRAGDQFQMTLQENPLAVGAVALALGAAVGLTVPVTRAENEYMGETRDNLIDKAQQVARDTMDKVQNVAQEAGRVVQREAKNQDLTV